jgi:hypothetical protein
LFGNLDYNCSFMHPKFICCYIHACQLALESKYGCAISSNNETFTTPYQMTLLREA